MNREGVCWGCGDEYKDLVDHYYTTPDHRPMKWDTCNQCNKRYKSLNSHWNKSSSCFYPENIDLLDCMDDNCGSQFTTENIRKEHYRNNPTHSPDNMVECPCCGCIVNNNLGTHWKDNDGCDYPAISNFQHQVITGLLMGDAWLSFGNDRNPALRARMETKPYLKHLSNDIFPTYGEEIDLNRTAEESARGARESGFRPNARKENYSDLYLFETRSTPKLSVYERWYEGEKPYREKVFPQNINLTPETLKHWYVCDGSYHNNGGERYITIAMTNERNNQDKISQYFEDVGISTPHKYDGNDNDPENRCNARWLVDGSMELFDHMGSPLPGFKYKWPEEYQ